MNIELHIDDSTQYATVYVGGQPAGTVRRRHTFDKATAPYWSGFNLEGKLIAATAFNNEKLFRKRLARVLGVDQ